MKSILENPFATLCRVAHRVVDRTTGIPYSADELESKILKTFGSAGKPGEYLSNTISFSDAGTLTTNEPGGIGLLLTEGNWDVEGHITFDESSATVTSRVIEVTTVAPGIGASGTEVYNDSKTTTTSQRVTLVMAGRRISIGVIPKTVFLSAMATFSAGGVDIYGHITARRVSQQ